MQEIISFFESIDPILWAFIATVFTWWVTAFWASFVFLFKTIKTRTMDTLLGFTWWVMVAASIWSLIIPGIDMSNGEWFMWVFPVVCWFSLWVIFLFWLDRVIPHLHINFPKSEKEGIETSWKKTTLMALAITLHNIPEGLAIWVMFWWVAAWLPEATIAGAVLLALGIGIQNFPEGIAIAMPLRRLWLSRKKSFLYGQWSALVEPVAAVIWAVMVTLFTPLLPYALAFAAGAMMFVVVEEVIPESQRNGHTDLATIGFMIWFLIMMSLDVVLS